MQIQLTKKGGWHSMIDDLDSPMPWDVEPAATERRERKVMIENAKHETARQLGGIIALTTFFSSHSQFDSWLVALLAAVVVYWIVTVPYQKDLQKAQAEYVAHTGRPVDFI